MVPEQESQYQIFGPGRIPTYSIIPIVGCWQSSLYFHHYAVPPPDSQMRVDWLPYDITSPSGRRIEVKSAAYLQSWTKEYYSQIIFDIAPKYGWTPEEGYAPERKRNSDLYVFCVYTALTRDKSLLDLDLWDFYVLPTSVLNEKVPEQKKIGLQSLLKLGPVKTDYASLGATIESIDL